MKQFFVILCTLAVAVESGLSTDEIMASFNSISASCQKETGITDVEIVQLMKHGPSGTMEAKCFSACFMKSLGVMDANGKFVKDNAMKIAEHHTQGDATKIQIAEDMLNVCTDIAVSDNHCEAAEQYRACTKAEAAKHGLTSDEY